jgi:hypothetical protein
MGRKPTFGWQGWLGGKRPFAHDVWLLTGSVWRPFGHDIFVGDIIDWRSACSQSCRWFSRNDVRMTEGRITPRHVLCRSLRSRPLSNHPRDSHQSAPQLGGSNGRQRSHDASKTQCPQWVACGLAARRRKQPFGFHHVRRSMSADVAWERWKSHPENEQCEAVRTVKPAALIAGILPKWNFAESVGQAKCLLCAGDPYGNRTRVSAVRGPRPNR